MVPILTEIAGIFGMKILFERFYALLCISVGLNI